jgi:SAM-dependent methyltransferase
MELRKWEERYRSRGRPEEDFASEPVALVARTARTLLVGRALDLTCGTGRNALWLAQQGWKVTAVDGASGAIEALQSRTGAQGLTIDSKVADLEKWEYRIEREAWDLICICYYLQRDLFEVAKRGLAPGGVVISIVHISDPGEPATEHRLLAGELAGYFRDMEILHSFEGQPDDPAHHRAVAEIVARRRAGPIADSASAGAPQK